MDLYTILKDYGPWVALVGIFVWHSWLREQRMAKRLDHVEDQIRERLCTCIEKNTQTMNMVLASLRSRPCLMDQELKPQDIQHNPQGHSSDTRPSIPAKVPTNPVLTALRSLVIFLPVFLFGCGRSQVGLVADARAGAQAYQAEQDPSKRAVIADGLAATVIASTDKILNLLPPPEKTPDQIQADPAAYAAAGKAAQADPPPYVPSDQPAPKPGPISILREIGATALRIGAWAAIAGIVALLLRFVPWWGIGAIFSWGPLSTLAGLSASLGSFATITGAATMWLADYLWIIVLVAVLAGIGVAVYHWRDIRKVWIGVRSRASAYHKTTVKG